MKCWENDSAVRAHALYTTCIRNRAFFPYSTFFDDPIFKDSIFLHAKNPFFPFQNVLRWFLLKTKKTPDERILCQKILKSKTKTHHLIMQKKLY